MAKTCKYVDKSDKCCTRPVFGGNFCSWHQFARTDKKPKATKKVSTRQKKKLAAKAVVSAQDRLFWVEIWDERPHVDFETGAFLGNEPLTLFFHHVLAKRPTAFPQYRFCKWNIILVSWETHSKAEGDLDNVPKIKEYTEKLKQLHEQGSLDRRVQDIQDLL